ncbi:DUF1439 domain-containing protein [Ramlibacter sp. PS3R-8]|uniref:DUF1439 domain-containing protein n=1 Tax=Ramlibacter sp. PS3R-8 TaxID=3133437 RepID=UPI0030A35D32
MDRRHLLTALACWPAARAWGQDDAGRPRHKISARELQDAVAARFPVRLGITGLVDIRVSAPRLLLLPARNRIGAGLLAQVGGMPMQPSQTAELDLAFALRYEPSDRTVRAHQLEVTGLRAPGLLPETAQLLQRLLPAMARDAVGEIVLHRFAARELALPETMGFEPDEIRVLEDGVLILFGPKQPR